MKKRTYPKLKTDWLSLFIGSLIVYKEVAKLLINRVQIPEIMYLGDTGEG